METAYRRKPAIHLRERRETGLSRIVTAAAALALGYAVLFAAGPAHASPETEAFIQETIDDGYVILNDASLSDDERFNRFREFMLSLTDLRRIATFTLGPYVNRASEAEVNEFVDAFSEYAVTVYEDRLSQYTGQTMRVVGSEDRAGEQLDSVVNATVVDPANPNAQPFNVAFRVRSGEQRDMIITDMQVEGVWLAISQRADFTSFLQRNNGSLPALSESLRRQAQQIRAGVN